MPHAPIDFRPVEAIADAVLYEGHLLYPYRPTALKNRMRWMFGSLFPPGYCAAERGTEASMIQTECLLRVDSTTRLEVRVRFLHAVERGVAELTPPLPAWPDVGEPAYREIEELRIGDDVVRSCMEVTDRAIVLPPLHVDELLERPHCTDFHFAAARTLEPVRTSDSMIAGAYVRWQEALHGTVEVHAEPAGEGLVAIRARIENRTSKEPPPPSREEAVRFACLSCHTLLGVQSGEFLSLLDPGAEHRDRAARCRNIGTWPVLAGPRGRRDLVLSAPIVLDDHPQIAAESPANLCDATEIDELLMLRIQTLAPAEKRELRSLDGSVARMLERAESLDAAQMLALHGAQREPLLAAAERELPRPGTRVRLHPRGRADAFDLVLAGKTAVILSIERDFEGRTYLAVTIDEDPGEDLGRGGWPGHRFFFSPDEVVTLTDS
jgi:hypothetical protein